MFCLNKKNNIKLALIKQDEKIFYHRDMRANLDNLKSSGFVLYNSFPEK